MATERIKRINEMIRRELALGIMRAGQSGDTATGKISIISAEVSNDLRGCAVMVSIMAEQTEADELMKWLRRNRAEFQSLIAKNIALKYTPKIFFKQTTAIEKGDLVLGILGKLDIEEGGPEPDAEHDAEHDAKAED